MKDRNIMHLPYMDRISGGPHFRVKYNFFEKSDGGRLKMPSQGYRSDLFYEGDDVNLGVYMVWPEFLDDDLNVITNINIPVSVSGYADMWIVDKDMIHTIHIEKLKVGAICYFMEGPRKVARAEIVSITIH